MIKKYLQNNILDNHYKKTYTSPIFKTDAAIKNLAIIFDVKTGNLAPMWIDFFNFLKKRGITYKAIGLFGEHMQNLPSYLIGHPTIQVLGKRDLNWIGVPKFPLRLEEKSYDIFINAILQDNFTASYISVITRSSLKVGASTLSYSLPYNLFIDLAEAETEPMENFISTTLSYMSNTQCNIQHINDIQNKETL